MKSRLAVTNVRFGSKADICAAKCDVRFTPNSDRKSRHAANGHVRFTPESGHVRRKVRCPLWANSGHAALARSDVGPQRSQPASLPKADVCSAIGDVR
jgi:hypothetical protein